MPLWRVEMSSEVSPMMVKDALDKIKEAIKTQTKGNVETVVTGDRAFLFIQTKEGTEVMAAYRRQDGKLGIAGYLSDLMIVAAVTEKATVLIEKISPAWTQPQK
mgnify:CR=1 FL=1